MKIRTLLIDGNNLLKRSYHGAKDVETANFGHLGGLYTFMTITRKLIKEHQINKVVIAWDGEGGGVYRYRIDKTYKANRKNKEWFKKIEMTAAEIRRERNKDESILKQRMRVQAYCEELFIRQIEVDDIEADDVMAAYCNENHLIEEIYLHSNDRDFAQLLNLNITILFPNIKTPITRTNYIMHFNHHYTNALTMKILCGDVSDNISGIAGLGEGILIKYFPDIAYKTLTVREICGRADKINKERVAGKGKNKKKPLKVFEALLENIDRLKTNFELVNLADPILNEEATEALEELKVPLSPDDRGSKNLYKMMTDDQFLMIYGSSFTQYVEPFYTVIMHEKQLLKSYIKENRKSL
jgi:5'-3' exonuclease